jgi:hypothetical protein
MTEIEKTLNGIVEIELKSGKYEMVLNHRAIAYIYEKYDQEPIEFIYEFNKTVKKGTEKLKDELEINNKIAKNITPAFLADMLYAGLLDSKKFDTVDAVIDDMIAVNYYSYKMAVLLMVGKLTRDFLTPSQTI